MKEPGDKPADEAESSFLARWSRRKSKSRVKTPPVVGAPQQAEAEAVEPDSVDPASLPPVDSLTADSDFSAFLKAGVPSALRVAALRKLWRTEPSVLEPDKLVEYGWDFNAPGYGEVVTEEQIARLRQTVFEGRPKAEPAQAPVDRKEAQEDAVAAVEASEIEANDIPGPVDENISAESESVAQGPAPRRRHGGALPR